MSAPNRVLLDLRHTGRMKHRQAKAENTLIVITGRKQSRKRNIHIPFGRSPRCLRKIRGSGHSGGFGRKDKNAYSELLKKHLDADLVAYMSESKTGSDSDLNDSLETLNLNSI
ncbi:hypothetical protein XENTR_v10000365 [Xenopus tropicalis]|nr:hypothetical protein XENTR_v10000365 [Xenopus tropicalis]